MQQKPTGLKLISMIIKGDENFTVQTHQHGGSMCISNILAIIWNSNIIYSSVESNCFIYLLNMSNKGNQMPK